MPTIEDVYFKFGFASEAAQLLEFELGTMLFRSGAIEAGLFENPDSNKAGDLLKLVNRKTLGQLIQSVSAADESLEELQETLELALNERNRLAHSFFREHNHRRNSTEGCVIMLKDLESVHDAILEAYKAVMRIQGIDLDTMSLDGMPTEHLPL
jgi:hypothetical protein